MDTFALQVAKEALLVGRYAIVTDGAAEGRPYLSRYLAEDCVSWWTEFVGGDQRLVRVVFREKRLFRDEKDGRVGKAAQYREYSLDPKGQASVRVWKPVNKGGLLDPTSLEYTASAPVILTRHGAPLMFLPVIIGGPMSLGSDVEKPPLLDLANAVLAHYQVAADYRHALHFVACPTLVVAGDIAPGTAPLKAGSSVAWQLTKDSTWGLVGAEAKNVAPLRDYLNDTEKKCAMLGARLLEASPRIQETATAASMRRGGEHSVLRTTGETIGQAMSAALRMMAWWQDTEAKPQDVEASYNLNLDFLSIAGTHDDVESWAKALLAGGMSRQTFAFNLDRAGLLRPDTTPEEEVATVRREEDADNFPAGMPNQKEEV